MYKAVVFDFDGTMIDTEKHLFEIINKHLKQHKQNEISLDYYRQSIGGAATALHNYLEEVLGIDNKNKIYEEHHETSVDLPIIESVQKLMDYCKQRHISMAIATSSYREDILPTFKNLGLDYNPTNCLALEDSVNGATAAVTAGLDVIVNTNEMTELQDFNEVAYIGKDLSAEEIIKLCFENNRG